MSKYTYTVWIDYGFDVETDKLLDPEDPTAYYALQFMADEKLREIGLDAILSEASYNNISVEENTDGNMDS